MIHPQPRYGFTGSTIVTEEAADKSLVFYVGIRNVELMRSHFEQSSTLAVEYISSFTELYDRLMISSPDTVIVEYSADMEDMAVLMAVIQRSTTAPIIVTTPLQAMRAGIVSMRNGAYNLILEPFEPESLLDAIQEGLQMRLLWQEVHDSKEVGLSSMGKLIGKATCMQILYQTIQNVSKTDATVFIQGPSGTGKDLVAQAIHQESHRSNHEYVAINCGAIPPNLLESELFGHERGAFTGAIKKRIGKFEQAHKGTLFLDEITELPLDLQVKLLRIIQDQKIVRVGGKDVIPVDVRIICASNREVLNQVKQGHFREDLYYRLNVVPIQTPPLCERRQDIPLLLTHFLNMFTEKYGKYFYEFSSGALMHLCSYPWPGNVREMENMIERIVVLNDGATVEERFLPDEVLKAPVLPKATGPTRRTFSSASAGVTLRQARPMWEVEREMIELALAETAGDVIAASHILEIGQATLYRKLKKYGLDRASYSTES